jgi:hypothetical protein
MPRRTNLGTRAAAHGERMIEIRVRLWTDNLAKKGSVVPKHAWTSGVVRVERNKTHGISPRAPKPFNSLLDLGAIIEKVLIEQGIVLHPSDRMRKYLSE